MYANKDLLNEFEYVHKIRYYGAFRLIHYSYLNLQRHFFFFFLHFQQLLKARNPTHLPASFAARTREYNLVPPMRCGTQTSNRKRGSQFREGECLLARREVETASLCEAEFLAQKWYRYQRQEWFHQHESPAEPPAALGLPGGIFSSGQLCRAGLAIVPESRTQAQLSDPQCLCEQPLSFGKLLFFLRS